MRLSNPTSRHITQFVTYMVTNHSWLAQEALGLDIIYWISITIDNGHGMNYPGLLTKQALYDTISLKTRWLKTGFMQ